MGDTYALQLVLSDDDMGEARQAHTKLLAAGRGQGSSAALGAGADSSSGSGLHIASNAGEASGSGCRPARGFTCNPTLDDLLNERIANHFR